MVPLPPAALRCVDAKEALPKDMYEVIEGNAVRYGARDDFRVMD